MMLKRKLPVIGLIAATIIGVSAAFAGDNISNSPSWPSWAPRATADSAGNFFVVWTELYGESGGDVFFSKYTKSVETWSLPRNISNSGRVVSEGNDNAGIACDGSGNVHVVWTERTIVRLRSLSGETWAQAGTIGEGAQLEGAKIAASGAGNLYIVWWGDDGVVRSRSRVNGAWESSRQISSSRRSKFADIAVGNNSVMATFSQKGSYFYNAAYVLRNVAYGAGWSAPAVVSGENRDQIYPDGEFLNGTTPQVIFIYENAIGEPSVVTHCPWTGNGFGPREVISYPGATHCPSLVEKSGVLVAVWQIGGWNRGVAIYYNYFYNGQWQDPTIIPDSRGATYSDVALDPAGAALAVWDGNGEIMALIMTDGEEPPPPNVDPVAEFSFLPATGSAPLAVNFDASASYDSDGTIAGYDWIFGDGQTAAGKTVTHTFATPGTYTNTLTVTDNLGATNSKSKSIEVINRSPVAVFTISSPSTIVTVKVDFDAGSSYDPDGSIVQYDWIFGDGVTAQGKTFSRVFTLPGFFSIKLTVTDNFSKTASLTKTFTLLALQAPLNIRWESFADDSLFLSRIVTDVQWEANPANDAIAEIVKYRVFRKEAAGAGAAYQLAAETDGSTFFWRDTGVEAAGQYVYTITSMDAAGHESLMPNQSSSQNTRPRRPSQGGSSSIIRR